MKTLPDKCIDLVLTDPPYGMSFQSNHRKFEVKNILVWVKNNTGMGDLEGDYAPQYEFIIYARKGNLKLNDGRSSNILPFSRTGNIHHPTEKPLDLFSFLIRKSTREGGTVFDGFLGGGTTALACKMLKRNYICCEISPEYCKIAEERIKAISNTLF